MLSSARVWKEVLVPEALPQAELKKSAQGAALLFPEARYEPGGPCTQASHRGEGHSSRRCRRKAQKNQGADRQAGQPSAPAGPGPAVGTVGSVRRAGPLLEPSGRLWTKIRLPSPLAPGAMCTRGLCQRGLSRILGKDQAGCAGVGVDRTLEQEGCPTSALQRPKSHFPPGSRESPFHSAGSVTGIP